MLSTLPVGGSKGVPHGIFAIPEFPGGVPLPLLTDTTPTFCWYPPPVEGTNAGGNRRRGEAELEAGGNARFLTTHWSQVLLAGAASSPQARQALEEICGAYWYPLYAFLRRRGHAEDDAADLVQGFFTDFLAREGFSKVRVEGGRFRSFLLRALQNHESHVRERAGALKRGGDRQQFQLDADAPGSFDQRAAEARYMAEPATNETPETLFERRFAEALIEKALAELRAEEKAPGATADFDLLSPFLAGDPPSGGYARLAEQTGRSEGALKVAVHRLRKRWRQGLLAEIARQVDRPQDIEDELRDLFRVLGGAQVEGGDGR